MVAPTGSTQPTGAGSTTRSGAAGQMVDARTQAGSRKGLWIGLGAIAIVAAAVTAIVVTQSPASAPVQAAAGSAVPVAVAGSGSAAPAPAVAGSGSAAPVALAACPPGQSRRDDTAGQCCWPGQAYSSIRCTSASEMPSKRTPRLRHARSMKKSASVGISSRRSRSGGTRMGNAASRK